MENRLIVIARKPQGKLTPDVFAEQSGAVPEPREGEALVRVRYLSIDAANRAWLQGRTYRDEVGAGALMPGYGLGDVVASRDPSLQEGDLVEGDLGWREHAVVRASELTPRERREPITRLLSALGITGLTAYFGLLEIGRPSEGETVVVSAAGGATGSVVGQIAKIRGARAVGIAGGAKKCAWLCEELGFDAAVDHRADDFAKQLKAACPSGVDVYFDNLGGDVLEAVLFRMNRSGRIACCGAVSQYDGPAPTAGPRGVPGLLVVQRIRMEGFLVHDFFADRPRAEGELAGWIADGRLRVVEDIVDGLENAPAALIGLLSGENRGKRLVRVS